MHILNVDRLPKENTSYVKNIAVISAKILFTLIQLQDLDNGNRHMDFFLECHTETFRKTFVGTTQSTCPPDFSDLFLCMLCVARDENVVWS